jgi:hypothetical protein
VFVGIIRDELTFLAGLIRKMAKRKISKNFFRKIEFEMKQYITIQNGLPGEL